MRPHPHRNPSTIPSLSILLAVLVTCVGWLVPATAATERPAARTAPTAVQQWITRHAVPLRSTEPGTDLADLAPLKRVVGDATVVGLGEATHGTREITTLKHRAVRYLVRDLGFRTLAWEDDWSLGLRIDRWVRGHGRPDRLASLVGKMSTAWRSKEVADVLVWIRRWNQRHQTGGGASHDQVGFVGVEYYTTRPFVYDRLERFIADEAPDRLAEAREHVRFLKPTTSDMGAYVRWYYTQVEDQTPYLTHARALLQLVEAVAEPGTSSQSDIALQTARQVRSFYVAFSLDDNTAYRDRQAARTLTWAHSTTKDRVIYWAAAAHTANAPRLRFEVDGYPPTRFASVGSYLRARIGSAYRSIGFTLTDGTFRGDTDAIDLPAAPARWFESALAEGPSQFLLDLRTPAPPSVRSWLEMPARTRGLPELGLASQMTGGHLTQWYDALVHRQRVHPDNPL